ncbi:DUF4292 domain-containing protein [bacterium]|nr:DUF4292 domain-containing protein [bacterium]
MKDYQVSEFEFDYTANCKARIKSKKADTYSGSCKIVVTHEKKFQLTVYYPVGGTLLAIYADEKIIQVLNRHERTFYQVENNKKNRKKIPMMTSFTIGELQSILWGRQLIRKGNDLQFLLKEKKPYEVHKKEGAYNTSILYKQWLKYEDFWFPKVMEIEDIKRGISIKLVITEFSPGFISGLEIKSIPEGYKVTL